MVLNYSENWSYTDLSNLSVQFSLKFKLHNYIVFFILKKRSKKIIFVVLFYFLKRKLKVDFLEISIK